MCEQIQNQTFLWLEPNMSESEHLFETCVWRELVLILFEGKWLYLILHILNLVHLSHISEIFNATYNDTWKENKKFAVQALRASGFGTRASESKVMNGVSL